MPVADQQRGWPAPAALLAGGIGSAAVGALAYRRGALSGSGVIGATIVGAAIFAGGGPAPVAQVLTFFISSSALSRWRRDRKNAVGVEVAKGERRDLAQVLANGGVAAACVALGRWRPDLPWRAALTGALATANADTWATELGMLSRRAPRLVTTWRLVTPGMSGGVTPLGTTAAVLGAALIGAIGDVGSPATRRGETLALAAVAGLTGAMLDSVLGATVQARYRCPACDLPTERTRHRCGASTVQTGGWRWLDNDAVNFTSSLAGGLIGWGWGTRGARR